MLMRHIDGGYDHRHGFRRVVCVSMNQSVHYRRYRLREAAGTVELGK